jgi:Domain of unknown function (DUF4190)
MSDATKNCPICGEQILAIARKCRYCGEYLDPAARPKDVPNVIERSLLPVGRPASAIAAGYLGLFGIAPLVGLPFAVLAIIFGIIAIKKISRDPSLCGKGRAWFGIITGSLGTLLTIIGLIGLVAEVMVKNHH